MTDGCGRNPRVPGSYAASEVDEPVATPVITPSPNADSTASDEQAATVTSVEKSAILMVTHLMIENRELRMQIAMYEGGIPAIAAELSTVILQKNEVNRALQECLKKKGSAGEKTENTLDGKEKVRFQASNPFIK